MYPNILLISNFLYFQTDSIAFRIFIDHEYCIASGGRYDRLIDIRFQYITNTSPILRRHPDVIDEVSRINNRMLFI